MAGMGSAVYLYLNGMWWESGGANGSESDRTGRVESQQVVEGGGIYKCECGIPALALIHGVPGGMCQTSGGCSLC